MVHSINMENKNSWFSNSFIFIYRKRNVTEGKFCHGGEVFFKKITFPIPLHTCTSDFMVITSIHG